MCTAGYGPALLAARFCALNQAARGTTHCAGRVQVNSASLLKKAIFNFAFGRKHGKLAAGGASDCAPLMDKLVFKTTKAAMGGEVRIIVSGGAPLSREVEEFLRVTMCCPVGQVCWGRVGGCCR